MTYTAPDRRHQVDPAPGASAALAPLLVGPLSLWLLDSRVVDPGCLSDVLPPENSDYLKVVLQLSGRMQVERKGNRLILQPGSWGIYGLSRACRTVDLEPSRQLLMLVPKSEFASRQRNIQRMMARQYTADETASALAFNFITSLYDGAAKSNCAFGSELSSMVLHLLQLALAEQSVKETHAFDRDRMRMRVRSYVDARLGDPFLSIESTAQALHCSTRYLHKLFVGGESLSRYIWNSRLDRCHEALADPAFDDQSITDIAFSWGFNNASHFSRAFRARFSVSPSAYRSARRKAAAPA